MKITFILPVVWQNGGCRVVSIYARKLLAMGHDVAVVSRLPAEQNRLRHMADFARGHRRRSDPDRTVYFDELGSRHVQVPHKFPLDAQDVPDADIVIATWWRTAFEVAALPSRKGRKVYFVQGHEVFPDTPWDIGAGSYYLPLEKITISSHLRDTMAREYGDRDVPVVENSVDTELFNAPPREKNSPPVVGMLYAPSLAKGIDVCLEAIRIARERIPELRVVTFGTEPPSKDFPLPKGSSHTQLPPQDTIRDLYARCDAWLCGSRTEGFHLPPLEAMACRVPVVTTRIGGAVEIVTEGINGHIVDIEDAAALGARLADVLSLSPENWRNWSDAAYARARSYSWDDAAKRFEALLGRFAAQS